MLSPTQRRIVVQHCQEQFVLSQRRACRALGYSRSMVRYRPRRPEIDKPLITAIRRLATAHPRYGYRKIWALLVREGWEVNSKRVHRLWKQEGLQVRRRRRIRRRGPEAPTVKAQRLNHVWSIDFVMDQTMDGRALKCLTVVDECSRQGLCIRVERTMGARAVRETLSGLFAAHGTPLFLRSDNGGEFLANCVRQALEHADVDTLFIEPGSPWQNGTNESFNGILRNELLDRELFGSLREAQVLTDAWLHQYNTIRPHGALGFLTPIQFAQMARERGDIYHPPTAEH